MRGKRAKCFLTYIHLYLFLSHPTKCASSVCDIYFFDCLGIVQYDADEKRVISAMWAKDEDISRFLRYELSYDTMIGWQWWFLTRVYCWIIKAQRALKTIHLSEYKWSSLNLEKEKQQKMFLSKFSVKMIWQFSF